MLLSSFFVCVNLGMACRSFPFSFVMTRIGISFSFLLLFVFLFFIFFSAFYVLPFLLPLFLINLLLISFGNLIHLPSL